MIGIEKLVVLEKVFLSKEKKMGEQKWDGLSSSLLESEESGARAKLQSFEWVRDTG